MNQPSLSELIEAQQAQPSGERFQHLLATFSQSSIGIVAVGVDQRHLGKTIQANGAEISLGGTQHGDGKSRILAFAEPKEFISNFGQHFNGEMLGDEIFNVVLHDPTCSGILLNSAKAPLSVPIEREAIQRFLQSRPMGIISAAKRAWWKFW